MRAGWGKGKYVSERWRRSRKDRPHIGPHIADRVGPGMLISQLVSGDRLTQLKVLVIV